MYTRGHAVARNLATGAIARARHVAGTTRHPAAGLAAAALLTACVTGDRGGTASPPGRNGASGSSSPAQATAPAGAREAPEDAVTYDVLSAQSELVVRVYRGGTLARLGHNHVIATTALNGTVQVAEPVTASHIALAFEKSTLRVDEPQRREAAGEDFAGTLPADAIDGTRENLLGPRLLDAVTHPRVTIESVRVEGRLPSLLVHARVRVRDQAMPPVAFPVTVTLEDGRLTATGATELSHASLGLQPFSVMLGALQVRDVMEVEYSIAGERRD